jgi:hypothetical protein
VDARGAHTVPSAGAAQYCSEIARLFARGQLSYDRPYAGAAQERLSKAAEWKALWSEDALISIAFPSAPDVAEVHHEKICDTL